MHYTEDELRSLFQQKFSRKAWTGFLQNFMEGARLRSVPEEFHTPSDNEKGFFLGEYNTSDHYRIGLFQFDVKTASIARKRVGLRNLVKSLINPNWGEFDAAFTVFASDSDWRLSFICDIKEEKTAPRRFTYVFGDEEMLYRTPVKRLYDIQGKVTFASLKKAFSVKELSDEFFYEYRDIYADFVQYITGNRYVKKTQGSGYELKSFPGEPQNMTFYQALGCDDKRARDFVKKMMGRITFLYFLQQKGWMCGDKNYMLHLFEKSEDKDFYLKRVLVPLFFGVLNTKPAEREAIFTAHGWNHALRQEWESIPYLNGGLFDPDDEDRVVDACQTHVFRQKDFEALFEFFNHYNFTIDENDPSDAEVGVDPEMLGKIFESLLEDNKDKGAFYTPKEIVQYMCQESLVAYLVAKTGIGEERLHAFVQNPDECVSSFNEDEQYKVLDGILSVKICDPAIGSGAFPIGLLNELVRCKEAIYGDKKGRADIKREIIRDNIYGVDIEKGAVDIARLRFWLSLVVDEDTPTPLPNLNYKIMQGNSLLEWYDGMDLSKLTDMAASDSLFGGGRAEELKQDLAGYLKRYFGESDHKKQSELKGKITATIKEILDIAGVSIPDDIDMAENNQFFLWHTWYNEVFSKGGFDIVIGNPPYISIQGMSESMRKLYKSLFRFFYHRYDIFGCFIEQGLNLLAAEGILTFIQPSVFLNSKSFMYCREHLVNECSILRLDLLKDGVFESAVVPTMIMSLKHKWDENNTIKCSQEGLGTCYLIRQSAFKNTEGNVFNLSLDEKVASFIANTEKNCVLLGDIARISRAINVGDYSKFLFKGEDLDSETYSKTIPVLKGASIHKWIYIPESYRLVPSFNEFVSSGDLDTLKQEKLMMKRIGKYPEVCYDNSGIAGLDTIYTIRITDLDYSAKYVMGLLNSRLIGHVFRLRVPLKGNVFPEFRIFDLNHQIPIHIATKEQQAPIISLVNDILVAKKANPSADTSIQEAEIDRLVYDLYDVPQEERHI